MQVSLSVHAKLPQPDRVLHVKHDMIIDHCRGHQYRRLYPNRPSICVVLYSTYSSLQYSIDIEKYHLPWRRAR
jgi:hypothetical protein